MKEDSHNIVVYAKDTAGNTGTSETIYFNIAPFPITLIGKFRFEEFSTCEWIPIKSNKISRKARKTLKNHLIFIFCSRFY